MDYINFLTRAEIIAERARIQTELNSIRVKKEPTETSEKEQTLKIKEELELTIKKCEERLQAQADANALSQANTSDNPATLNGDIMVKMQETARMQQILETVRSTRKLKTGESIESFVCGLNQVYCIEVKPQLATMKSLETEFVNCAKGLLTYPMFSQLEKSGKNITTWSDLESYLIDTHGSRISNFQYLHRLWNCQLQESEKFSDFGARLEEQIHHASMHIQASFKKNHSNTDMTASDVFSLMGAMLAGIQVKDTHEDAYKSLIKTCDKHWSASSLLSDAADYADKMQSGELTPRTNTVFHAKVAKKTEKTTDKKTKKPTKGTSTKKSLDRLEEYKLKCKKQICQRFLEGTCQYGSRCFRQHPVQSHFTGTENPDVEREDEIANLFHQGPEN